MIRRLGEEPAARPTEGPPWAALELGETALCCLWTSGPDPACDRLVRLLATRGGGAGWDVLDLAIELEEGEEETAEQRELVRDASERVDAEVAWRRLLEFVRGRALLVVEGEGFDRWAAALADPDAPLPTTIGLVELVALCLPGRLAARGAHLVADFASDAGPRLRAGFAHPLELAGATLELVRRVHEQTAHTRRLLACGYGHAIDGLRELDPPAARRLALALGCLDRPSAWAPPIAGTPPDGRLASEWSSDATGEELVRELLPRVATRHADWASVDPLPPMLERDTPFDPADLARLDRVFEEELPRAFAVERESLVLEATEESEGGHDAAAHEPASAERDATEPPESGLARAIRANYRRGQHLVAREIATCLGSRELLLIHAPTGTGKTLAYLVPAILWSLRHGVRVGISTYTRALQEQAMDRELPRALRVLALTGPVVGLRVSMLKGRENYLCWRSLRLATPAAGEAGEGWLAWTALALFGATDDEGDLDRFPARPPIPLRTTSAYLRQRGGFLRDARARSSCCRRAEDKGTCAAELARRRAERSHLVLTNHAFALARQEFFRHLVFDECEHLHDQAHNAWSHVVSLQRIQEVLSRFHAERDGSRALLDRIVEGLVEGSPAHERLQGILEDWYDCAQLVGLLRDHLRVFDRWRHEAGRERDANHQHSLLREFFEREEAGARELLHCRVAFSRAGSRFDAALAELAERLDDIPIRNRPRARRALEQGRLEWNEVLSAVEAWLPVASGLPAFRRETFYEVERDGRGDFELCARVLLPNEFLGRQYFPNLAGAALLSATTHVGGSFDAAKGFLGLDRAAEPLPDEEREPCRVRTHRSPEAFDYGRVLVCVPRDAPPVQRDKELYLDYVRTFVQRLGERTRGRVLVLFTNAADTQRLGEELFGWFRARQIPLWYQGMRGMGKEELGTLFRERVDSILFGVDTFWYGADFPGETLEYLVIVRLPYGVPDGYHHAQCAAIGTGAQRSRIYMPRALAKIRQGFGRLMRTAGDKGCVFILDNRVLEPRHRRFLKELPIETFGATRGDERLARFVRGDTEHCLRAAFAHMGLPPSGVLRGAGGDEAHAESGGEARRGDANPPLDASKEAASEAAARETSASRAPSDRNRTDGSSDEARGRALPPEPPPLDVDADDLPF